MRCVPGSTRPAASDSRAVAAALLLARTAYAVHDSLGLQRARVHSITLRADALRPATRATRQLTLDAGDDKPLALEAVADRAR
jgi:DNA polymerase-4